jgi:hypothetical protein
VLTLVTVSLTSSALVILSLTNSAPVILSLPSSGLVMSSLMNSGRLASKRLRALSGQEVLPVNVALIVVVTGQNVILVNLSPFRRLYRSRVTCSCQTYRGGSKWSWGVARPVVTLLRRLYRAKKGKHRSNLLRHIYLVMKNCQFLSDCYGGFIWMRGSASSCRLSAVLSANRHWLLSDLCCCGSAIRTRGVSS